MPFLPYFMRMSVLFFLCVMFFSTILVPANLFRIKIINTVPQTPIYAHAPENPVSWSGSASTSHQRTACNSPAATPSIPYYQFNNFISCCQTEEFLPFSFRDFHSWQQRPGNCMPAASGRFLASVAPVQLCFRFSWLWPDFPYLHSALLSLCLAALWSFPSPFLCHTTSSLFPLHSGQPLLRPHETGFYRARVSCSLIPGQMSEKNG